MLRKILFTAVVAATAAASMNVSAIGRLADVTVIDRSTGGTLPVHFLQRGILGGGHTGRQLFGFSSQRLGWPRNGGDVG